MDPNAALEKIRALVKDLFSDSPTPHDTADTVGWAIELAEAVEALDAWLSQGNSLPESWKRRPTLQEQRAASIAAHVEQMKYEGIGYVWGRRDGGDEDAHSRGETEFAEVWSEAVRKVESREASHRPAINTAYDLWKQGEPIN